MIGNAKSRKLNRNKKGNLSIPKRKIIAIIIIALISVTLIFGFGAWAYGLGLALKNSNCSELLFVIFGCSTIAGSFVLNVFVANSTLFEATDNELILSLPIKPLTVLFSRLTILIINCLIISALTWIPACIGFYLTATINFKIVAANLVMMIDMACISLVFSTLVGWFISYLNKYPKLKKVSSVILIALLILFAFTLQLSMNVLSRQIIADPVGAKQFLMSSLYALYVLGLASCGEIVPLLIVTAVSLIAFFLVFCVVAANFNNLLKTKKSSKKKQYVQKQVKRHSISSVLLSKEAKLFVKYNVYFVNCGIGLVLNLILAVAFIAAKDIIAPAFLTFEKLGFSEGFVVVLIIAAVGFLSSTNCISTPAVSIEGKSLWILKSLPVSEWDVLKTKTKFHIILNSIPACLAVAVGVIVFNGSIMLAILAVLLVFVLIVAGGFFGILVGTLRANLTWTNPAVPVKQNLSVLFSLLFGWALVIAFCATYFAFRYINFSIFVTGWIIFAALITLVLLLLTKKFAVPFFKEL